MHHRDPFDRILVAQAQAEALTLITRDPDIAKYDVSSPSLLTASGTESCGWAAIDGGRQSTTQPLLPPPGRGRVGEGVESLQDCLCAGAQLALSTRLRKLRSK